MADEIAYRELWPGEVIQAGDEFQAESGRWVCYEEMIGQPVGDRGNRRPYNITQIAREQREASEAAAIWQRAGQAAIKERDEARAAMQDAYRERDSMRRDRDRLVHSVNDLLKKNHHMTNELARLQQPPAADHIADVSKMVESELERKAWELFCRSDERSTCDSFDDATRFITERNRRRQIQRENDAIIADVVGDRL